MIIGYDGDEILMETLKHENGELRYLVGTRWMDKDGNSMQISIGVTTKSNIVNYALLRRFG